MCMLGDMIKRTGIASPVAIFIVVVAFCFTLSLRYPDDSDPIAIAREDFHQHITFIALMSVGLVFIAYFLCSRSNISQPIDDTGIIRDIHLRRLVLSGIILFFVVGSVLDVEYVTTEIACFDEWHSCAVADIRLTHVVNLVYYIVRFVFTGSETTLCWVYHKLRFSGRHLLVVHGLALVLAINVVLWFDLMLDKTYDRTRHNETTAQLAAVCVGLLDLTTNWTSNSSNVLSQIDLQCWTRTSPEYHTLQKSSVFLFPIYIEFALLVGENLAGWIGGCVHDLKAPKPTASESAVDGEEQTVVDVIPLESYCSDHAERQSTSGETNPIRIEASSVLRKYSFSAHADSWHSCVSKVFLTLSAPVNVGFIVVNLINFVTWAIVGKKEQRTVYAAVVYYVAYTLFLSICAVVGCLCCRHLPRPQIHTSNLEYLLLGSALGPLFIFLTAMTHNCFDWEQIIRHRELHIFGDTILVVQILLQLMFYFSAKDIDVHPSAAKDDDFDGSSVARLKLHLSRSTAFGDVLAVMAFSNAVLWLMNSFDLLRLSDKKFPGQDQLYNLANPMTIFFRFTSTLLFWCLYKNARQSIATPNGYSELPQPTVGL